MTAMRAVSLTDTPRGPFKFDHLGNVVGNFYIGAGIEGAKTAQALEQDDQDLSECQPVLDLGRRRNSSPSRSIRATIRRWQVLSRRHVPRGLAPSRIVMRAEPVAETLRHDAPSHGTMFRVGAMTSRRSRDRS